MVKDKVEKKNQDRQEYVALSGVAQRKVRSFLYLRKTVTVIRPNNDATRSTPSPTGVGERVVPR